MVSRICVGEHLQVLAERAAWEVARKEGLDLVVINPSFILGPALSANATAAVVQTFAVWRPFCTCARTVCGLA